MLLLSDEPSPEKGRCCQLMIFVTVAIRTPNSEAGSPQGMHPHGQEFFLDALEETGHPLQLYLNH